MAARESNQQSDKPTLSMIIQVCLADLWISRSILKK